MKPIKFFVLILLIGLAYSNLHAQSKSAYVSFMDKQVGEWMLDRESAKREPTTDQPVPKMKMTFIKEGESYKRNLYYSLKEGEWTLGGEEIFEYDETNKWMTYSGANSRGESFRGQLILMEDGQVHGVEFNSDNQKTSEMMLDISSPEVTKVSSKSFVYPKNADEDMQIIKFETAWIKQ